MMCVSVIQRCLCHTVSIPHLPLQDLWWEQAQVSVYIGLRSSWQAVRKIIMLAAQSAEASFYDDLEGGTFGTLKKGIRRPLSNFNFQFKRKIIATSSSTGFLVTIIPEENAHLEEHTQ